MHSEPKRKGDLQALSDGTLTEADARAMLERMRWPNGVVCPLDNCGGSDAYHITVKGKTLKSGRVVGPRELFKCRACKRQFSVTKGTIFEDSKIPLRTWLVTMYRMGSSKKGVSARQIGREFGLTPESAWFMLHRIRYAMTDKAPLLLQGTIEADETYVGGKVRGNREWRMKRDLNTRMKEAWDKKVPVFGIQERGGRVHARVIRKVETDAIERTVWHGVDRDNSRMMTDEHPVYRNLNKMLPHDVIRHKSEYVRGEVHTQSIESFWALLKRGLIGTYHQVDAGYLNQYVQEFAFRSNTRKVSDRERFERLMSQIDGRVDWYLGKQAASVSEASE